MEWTDESAAALRRMWNEEGLSATQIARTFGPDVTRNMIIGKVHRLGLDPRSRSRAASQHSTERRMAQRARHLPANWREVILFTQAMRQPSHVAAERLGMPRRTICKVAKDAGIPFPPSNGTSGAAKAKAKERKEVPLRFDVIHHHPAPKTQTVLFIDRRTNQCAWPLWSSPKDQKICCGEKVAGWGYSYCRFHHNIGTVQTHAIPRHFVEAAE